MTSPFVPPGALPAGAVVLDVRWTLRGPDRPGYRAAHVPGAVFCDLHAVLAAPPGERGRHPLPDPGVLGRRVADLGVSVRRTVVVYDGGDGASAARAWWCLRWLGHPGVRVLDGGLAGWVDSGRPTEAGEVAPAPVPDSGLPGPGFPHLPVLDADGAARTARTGVLLDVRSPERFRGEHEPVDPVAGHIPGAVNAPDPGDAVRAARGAAAVGAYCGSGITAARTVLALHAAGIDAALYPGSWSEWIRDPARPVARG